MEAPPALPGFFSGHKGGPPGHGEEAKNHAIPQK
jgi:hypothetical protein